MLCSGKLKSVDGDIGARRIASQILLEVTGLPVSTIAYTARPRKALLVFLSGLLEVGAQ